MITDTDSNFVSFLIEKFKKINDFKSQSTFEILQNEKEEKDNKKDIKHLHLEPNVEESLLKLIQDSKDNLYDLMELPALTSREDRIRLISKFDVLFRTLMKIGFEASDICNSFKATMSLQIEDHFDYLLINTSEVKIPINFFDKYCFDIKNDTLTVINNQLSEKFDSTTVALEHEDLYEDYSLESQETLNDVNNDLSINIIQSNKRASVPFSKHFGVPEVDPELNQRIMQYVEKFKKSASTIQDVNEQYANTKHKLMKLEKQINMTQKVKNQVTDDELQKIYRDIEKLKSRMTIMELDIKFNKTKSDMAFKRKLTNVSKEKSITKVKTINEVKDLNNGAVEHSDYSNWNVITFTSNAAKRMLPKDILVEYCKKNNLGVPTIKTTVVCSGIWRASVNIPERSIFNKSYTFDLPARTGTSTLENAKQLISMYAMFKLDCNTNMYKVWPQCYKDLWSSWSNEKIFFETFPSVQADQKRLAFLNDLVDNQPLKKQNSNTRKIQSLSSGYQGTRSQGLRKRQMLFKKMKRKFMKRVESEEYTEMMHTRADLPVTGYREEILQLIHDNKFIIVSGETGSGKSAQIPQFIAEDLLLNSDQCGSVVCTQPRRISAISIAQRVSSEMCDPERSVGGIGSMVGYNVRFQNKSSSENVLIFCTTGILLRILEKDQHLNGVTHVVIDEVHERTIEIDFLLLVLKQLCYARDDIRVILMSATAETHKFSQYLDNCPVMNIPGRAFPVKAHYLEEIVEMTGYTLDENSSYALRQFPMNGRRFPQPVSQEYDIAPTLIDGEDVTDTTIVSLQVRDAGEQSSSASNALNIIKQMDPRKINFDLILQLLLYIQSNKKSKAKQKQLDKSKVDAMRGDVDDDWYTENQDSVEGAILIFLPGLNEIRNLLSKLSNHRLFGNRRKYVLVALHSSISSDNQDKAFEIPPAGITKIILSTNIAETGVTISDVTVVIDTGMAKVVSYDRQRQISQLEQKYVAQANVLQRRGRAGRLREGESYHLFTEQVFEEMDTYEVPEILRLPLEEVCLRIKICNMGHIKPVLYHMIDIPSEMMIENAITTLIDVQALTEKEALTPLGVHLANLPLNVHLGKMIIFGAVFRCLDPILTIAAALTNKTPFTRPLGEEIEADMARNRFRTYDSDFMTTYRAYSVWKEHYMDLKNSSSEYSPSFITRQMRSFCKENYLSYRNLEVIEDTKKEYLDLLVNIGFVAVDEFEEDQITYNYPGIQFCKTPDDYNTHSDSIQMMNAAIAAGLYPKVAQIPSKNTNQIHNKNYELQINFSSVLHQRNLNSLADFLVYNTAIVSGYGHLQKVLMWEISWIDSVLVVLFSNDIQIKHKIGRIVIDKWIHIKCPTRTCILLKLLRRKLTNCLAEKMRKPGLNLNTYNEELMNILVSILESASF